MGTKVTRNEKKAAQNPDKQIFENLHEAVKNILRKAAPEYVQYYNADGVWKQCESFTGGANRIYRIDPNAPTASEVETVWVQVLNNGLSFVRIDGITVPLIQAQDHERFVAYLDNDGMDMFYPNTDRTQPNAVKLRSR